MLPLLFLIAAAAATPLEGEVKLNKKIIPLWEDSMITRYLTDSRVSLKSMCIDDCHHHIIEKPVFIVGRKVDGKYDMHYLPFGLNWVGKSSLMTPINHLLVDKTMGVLAPMAKFPFELFPGLLDTDVLTPEHHEKFSHFYKEAPILMMLNDEEFKKFNEKMNYIQVADMSIEEDKFMILKDYAQFNRHAPVWLHDNAPGLYYLVPTTSNIQGGSVPSTIVPSTTGVVPLTSNEYIRYLSSSSPTINPNYLKSFAYRF